MACVACRALNSVSFFPCCDRLAPIYPDQLMVGMEIRDKVATYVRERIGKQLCALTLPTLCSVITSG
jgi:hypothetical protein